MEERQAIFSWGNGYSFLLYIRELTPAHKTDTQMYYKPGFIGLLPTEGFSQSVGRHDSLQVEIKCNLDVNVREAGTVSLLSAGPNSGGVPPSCCCSGTS